MVSPFDRGLVHPAQQTGMSTRGRAESVVFGFVTPETADAAVLRSSPGVRGAQ